MRVARKGLGVVAAVTAALLVGGVAAATHTASAAIAASNITAPTDPTFFSAALDPSTNQTTDTFAVHGTTTSSSPGDMVDTLCYYGTTFVTVAGNVPINPDGSFFVPAASMESIWNTPGKLCRLRAVPAGTTPADPAPFSGPRVSVDGSHLDTISGGLNDGAAYDYYIWAGQLTGAFDYVSLGSCGLYDGYLFDPALALTTTTFYCNAGLFGGESPTPTRSELQIDGANAYPPDQAQRINPNAAGFPALSLSAPNSSWYYRDPATGNFVIQESDPLVKCADPTYPPTPVSCATFASTGVTDNRTITQDHDGHISWISDIFTSTDGRAHSLDLLWDNEQHFNGAGGDATQVEYEFPSEGSYSMHTLGDVVTLPATSPGTILIRMHGAAEGDTSTGQGAIVYDRPATAATFNYVATSDSDFTLHQADTVPAGGSTRFRFAYVQDYHAADVASMAQAANSTFLNGLGVGKYGNGSGTVTSSTGEINCGTACSHSYPWGTTVTLTATPATGSTFTGWQGVPEHPNIFCTPTGANTCTATMGACVQTGDPVLPSCTGAPTSGGVSVTAVFTLIKETLTVSKRGDGKGTVTEGGTSHPSISCGHTCSHSYDYGRSITLKTNAAKGSSFGRWSGACTGRAPCTVAMTATRSVTATFVKNCTVPKLKGKSLKKARRLLRSHDCRLGKVRHAHSTKVKKGRVISSKPKAGKHLKHNAKVSVVLSKG